ncbi:hypothetical protein XELAEV_18032314mg [Xenopus laevis]|uniref:Uncharacterized protein n=1 Tax=Xenopus laevis TaxID=8355 RepID=A0A974HGL7_XENLA|nr:hypothetical protein XELAEV_18032314mg [Xenopus laevis]
MSPMTPQTFYINLVYWKLQLCFYSRCLLPALQPILSLSLCYHQLPEILDMLLGSTKVTFTGKSSAHCSK